jgi:ATP-grasp domain-containing protein
VQAMVPPGDELLVGAVRDTSAGPVVVDCLRRVAWLADDVGELAEIDVNPLVVTASLATALDVRVRVQPPT